MFENFRKKFIVGNQTERETLDQKRDSQTPTETLESLLWIPETSQNDPPPTWNKRSGSQEDPNSLLKSGHGKGRTVLRFEGNGYPSSSRVLVKFRLRFADPNGYYDLFELSPTAPLSAIKARFKELAKQCHPDSGSEPDAEAFSTIKAIYNVLRDPVKRAQYNATKEGDNFIGEAETMDIMRMVREGKMTRSEAQVLTDRKEPDPNDGWTFFGNDSDLAEVAQEWYQILLEAAWFVGYEGVIRVALDEFSGACKTTKTMGTVIFWFNERLNPTFMVAYNAMRLEKSLEVH